MLNHLLPEGVSVLLYPSDALGRALLKLVSVEIVKSVGCVLELESAIDLNRI